MNILYIASLQRFPGHHAGFTHAMNMAKALRNIGNHVHLLARADGEHPAGTRAEIEKVPVAYVHWPLRFRNWVATYRRSRRELQEFVKEWEIDIIHERFEMPFAVGTFHARHLGQSGILHVLEANSPFVEEFYGRWHPFRTATSVLRKMQFKRTRRIIAQTPLLQNMFTPITRTHIDVVSNGADPDLFTPEAATPGDGTVPGDESAALRLRYGIAEDEPLVGFSGSFRYWHGAQDLICALEHLSDRRTKLLFMGGGHHLDDMKQTAQHHGFSDRCIFTGPLPHHEIPAHLRLCRVLAAPFNTQADPLTRDIFARYDMWWSPLKIFEYMATGRPVVSPELGMIPEYLGYGERERGEESEEMSGRIESNTAGLVYPEGAVRKLAERIETLLADEQMAQRMGNVGRQRILNHYSWERQAQRTVAVYERIMERT